MTHNFSIVKALVALSTLVLVTLPVSAQERGELLFGDNFDTPTNSTKDWDIPKRQNELVDGQVKTGDGGGGMVMRREIPDEFWAEMDVTFDSPSNPQGNSRAGFAIGKNYYFLLSPNGYHFGWRGQQVEGFEIGKPTRITLIRKRFGIKTLYVFMANGKELWCGFLPWEKNGKSPLATFCYKSPVRFDNFALYALKAEEPVALIQEPVFSASFENTLDAKGATGETIIPAGKVGGSFPPGVSGAGFSPDSKAPPVSYPLEKSFNHKAGGVSFWAKSNDGHYIKPFDLDGKFIATLDGQQGAHIDIMRSDAQKPLNYLRWMAVKPGDWHHVALTWEEDGSSKFFVDGLPYSVCFKTDRCPVFFHNADLDGLKKLTLGSRSNLTLDELKLYNRPLGNEEIVGQYRAVMPIDLVMERSIVDGPKGESVTIQAAPGGYYMRPNPISGKPFVKADVSLKLELFDGEGKQLKSETKQLKVDKPIDVAMESLKLPVGNYKLVATVNFDGKNFQRTFNLASFSEEIASAEVGKKPYQLGKQLFEKNFDDPADKGVIREGDLAKSFLDGVSYLEAGSKGGSRFGCVVNFPEESFGKPVELEISWPDDKMRNMGLYMYVESKLATNRDRIQGGVQAGNEYPNGGKIEKARYIFYPACGSYLFEARTLATGQPAAVSSIRARMIDGGLPRLAVHLPEGMEGRHFGHYDEDQSFTNNLRVDMKPPKEFPRLTLMQNEDLMRYLDYTGQNTMHYPVWRYTYSYVPREGYNLGNGMYPNMPGELSYLFDSFRRHGKKFVAIINYYNLPEVAQAEQIQRDFLGEGMLLLDKAGDEVKQEFFHYNIADFANPTVRSMFVDYFRDIVKRYAKHLGFGGLEWCMVFGIWPSLDVGYGDYTVNAFSKATGINVTGKAAERYEFLTKEPVRAKWLKWRSEQVTEFVREMRAMFDEYNPDLKLDLAIPQSPDMYETRGVDLAALKGIKGVTLVAERGPTFHRWMMYRGKPEPTSFETMYETKAPMVKDFLVDGSVGTVSAMNSYFESRTNSMMPERFPSYFQSPDVKQHGRFFLKEPAFALGAMDALEFVIGGQPLGTLGRDAETREFTQAYCALPAKPFKTIPGLDDPAVARYLNTPNGTYFYAVNMHHCPVRLKLSFDAGHVKYLDLSTDKMLSEGEIELRPFELRSFLIPKQKVGITNVALSGDPDGARAFYDARITKIKAAIAGSKADTAEEAKVLAAVEQAVAEKRYGEAHRLCFSQKINLLLQSFGDPKTVSNKH